MASYVVIEVTVKDREKFKEYVAGHLPSILRYGGKILCREFDPSVVAGNWAPELLVIQEWPDEEQFRLWYDSEEYRPWKALREDACAMNMVFVGAAP